MSRVKHREVMDKAHGMRIRCQDVYVDFYRPGDGVTRYRFFAGPADYFESGGLGTVLGAKAAMIWLEGYEAGHGQGFDRGREYQKERE